MERTRWNDDLETWCDERYYRKDEVDEMISRLELNSGLVFSVEVEDEVFSVGDGVQEFRANLSYANGSGVDGKNALFSLVDSNGNNVDTSLVTTDVDGYAVYEYTPTGRGQVFVTASYGTLLQETFVIKDCIAIDNATDSDHNDSIWGAVSRFNRGTDYTTFTHTALATTYVEISDNVCIEFDIQSNTNDTNSALLSIRQDNTVLLQTTRSRLNISANDFNHIKIEIKNNECTITNTDTDRSVTGDVTGFNRCYFRISANESIQFKNLKIYSI